MSATYEVTNTREKPPCQCCGGTGMHYYRAYVGGASPDDDDLPCSTCAGTGESWFDARQNSCAGWRDLMKGRL